MEWITVQANQIQFFLMVFVRVSIIIALLPVFGSQSIPTLLKIAFALIFSAILYNTSVKYTINDLHMNFTIGSFIFQIIKEAGVGFVVGFAASFLFAAVQFAGRLIDTEMGFGFVELVDPFTDETVTVWGQLQVILFTILFLLFNGHYFLLLGIERSYELVPLLKVNFHFGPLSVMVTKMIGDIFILAIKLAAPIYVPLLLTELSMGVIARTVPQLNIFFVGMPLKIVIGLTTAIIVLPALAIFFQKLVANLTQDIWRLLYLMA